MISIDLPIDYYHIEESHFRKEEGVNEVINAEITVNEDGYINDSFQEHLILKEKNLVVLNCGVGQGKSYSIIATVNRYLNSDDDYLVFVASPYVSLITQYYNDLLVSGVEEDALFRYELLGSKNPNYLNKKVHVVTANLLLENPGEDAPINSEAKRRYLSELSKKAVDKKMKTVIIFDELHASVHNFKERFIFSLYRWHKSIHKIITASATYTPASTVVLNYLAELIGNKVLILESKRVQKSNPSQLHIYLDNNGKYSNKNATIIEILKDLTRREKDYDILTYSRKLAEELGKKIKDAEGANKIIFEKYDNVQLCISDMKENQRLYTEIPKNRYDSEHCNIGTNFSTGISISKDNHALIVIMPPSSSKNVFKNFDGIFSNGYTSIVQTIARQRKNGEIHIIAPNPQELDFDNVNIENSEKNELISFWDAIKAYQNKDSQQELKKINQEWFAINHSDTLLHKFYYQELKVEVATVIDSAEKSVKNDSLDLSYPSKNSWILSTSDEFLRQRYSFFGADLASNLIFNALTNQFVNCKLQQLEIKTVVYFTKGNLYKDLIKFRQNHLTENLLKSVMVGGNDLWMLEHFKKAVYSDFKSLYITTEKKSELLSRFTNNKFEIALLRNILFVKNSPITNWFNSDLDVKTIRKNYFLMMCSVANNLTGENIPTTVKAYRQLLELIENLNLLAQNHVVGGNLRFTYLPVSPSQDIKRLLRNYYPEIVEILLRDDELIANNVITFKNEFTRQDKTRTDKLNTFYNYLINIFYDGKRRTPQINSVKKNVYQVEINHELPDPEHCINLFSPETFVPSDITYEDVRDLYVKDKKLSHLLQGLIDK